MSQQQPLNLRRSLRIVRRNKALIGIAAAIGLLGGAGYAVINAPKLTSSAIVVVPLPKPNIQTQTLIAGSAPVLSKALAALGSSESVELFEKQINVINVTPNAIQITATEKSGPKAEAEANAVANAYVEYTASSSSPVGPLAARILVPATVATGSSATMVAVEDGGIGLLAGAVIAFMVAIRRGRADQRLRQRNDLASSGGIPVLCSVPVESPADETAWSGLIDRYQSHGANARQLRGLLEGLGVTGAGGASDRHFLTVVSFTGDRKATAFGPQLAAFAATEGIPTALVARRDGHPDDMPGLRGAASALAQSAARRLPTLKVIAAEAADGNWQHMGARLTVVALGTHQEAPQLPGPINGSRAIFAVSAGVVTASQLARAVAQVTVTGSRPAGIVVLDPEPDDATTGLVPKSNLSADDMMPTRLNGGVTEMRR
jgi:capsular polysaccharide biosynthesis protein